MHGTVVQSANALSRRHSQLDELREELVIARNNLVAAVAERSSENLLAPLRNKVGELLESIEKLYSVDRFRRLD